MSRRKDRRCHDCGQPLRGRGGRATRCGPCQAAVNKVRDADRHAANRERRSTLRRLARQGLSEAEPEDLVNEVVNYTRAEQAPRLDPAFPYRPNPRHDAATRASLDLHESASDEPDQATAWDRMFHRGNSDGGVIFPAPNMGTSGRGIRGRDSVPEITDWAAAGMLHRPSPAAGQRAMQAHVQDRFGGKVAMSPPIHSGQLESNAPHLQAREQVQIEQQRMASEHARSLAGYNSMRR